MVTALTLPRLSVTLSVTISVNHGLPAGIGGDGMMVQFTAGIASTGPVVRCENSPVAPYVQSHATMVPGAVEVLPLNVQFNMLPLAIAQVSVSVAPVTPKLAIATLVRITASVADADPPP